MSDISELLLKKYYGCGAASESQEIISTHESTNDQCERDGKTESVDTAVTGTIEDAGAQQNSSQATKDEEDVSNDEWPISNGTVRSSRVISDDDISEDEKSDIEDYDTLLGSTGPRDRDSSKEMKIPEADDPSPRKIEKSNETTELFERNDPFYVRNIEDALSENASDISSVRARKNKPKKTVSALDTSPSTVSPQTPELPKKLPACDGIFLDLTKLSLVEFPVFLLADIPNLRMLYLENNLLTELPEQLFTSLRLLQWLDVRNNRLESLPANIKHHPSLETVLLDGNLFQRLPPELCLLPNLKELQTSRNPIAFPPPDVLALGFAATIHFLRTEWNNNHPEEVAEFPERNKKTTPSTILCSDPPILRKLSKSSRIFGSSSTGHVAEGTKKISVRQKARNYRPSNRCENRGTDGELEKRLWWIARVKEMLTEQTIALQKIKDRDALNDWRRDRRSYDKSIRRAANRTEEDIPFAVDLKDNDVLFKNRLKTSLQISNSRKQDPDIMTNINEKMTELYDSLKKLQRVRKSDVLSPRSVQKLLDNEIKKLSDVQNEIQNLRRCNVMTTAPFESSEIVPESQEYKPPPSIII